MRSPEGSGDAQVVVVENSSLGDKVNELQVCNLTG